MKRRTIAWLVVPVLLITAGAVKSDANNVVEITLHGHYFSEPATGASSWRCSPTPTIARCASKRTAERCSARAKWH